MIEKKIVNNKISLTVSLPSSKGSPLTMSHVDGYNVKITNEQGESLNCSIKDFNELNYRLEQWVKSKFPITNYTLTDDDLNNLFTNLNNLD